VICSTLFGTAEHTFCYGSESKTALTWANTGDSMSA
jgi:hypothetical protein